MKRFCALIAFAAVCFAQPRPPTRSKITIFTLKDKSSQVIYTSDKIFEAPNWSRDGKFLMVNSGGNLYRLAVDTPNPEPGKIDLGPITGCNNDHGISPDGRLIALSARSGGATGSQVYVARADGSNWRLMTPLPPSYYHGWSPDGKWLAYTAQRDGNFDVYRVPVTGGPEQRLTSNPGLDDGPEYSPDGKWIYVNSDRTGNFDIWRFPADGAGPDDAKAEQVTKDDMEDWFPHPSPDGKWMVFVSFEKGTKGHPPNQNVSLRMMPFPGGKLKTPKIEVLAKLFGGQGTMNVNSWSPDSKRFAYVSYELIQGVAPAAATVRPHITGVAHLALAAKDYEASRAFYHDFLGLEEPYSLKKADGTPSMTFFKVNERQYIELSPETEPNTDRLKHISIETDNAEGMRAYLASKGIKVPDKVGKGRIGNSNFNITDPEGHTVEIVQYEPDSWTVRERGKYLPDSRISQRMMHVGIIVTQLDAEMTFYRDVLGFQETWRGSKSGTELSWVNLKVPDGDDYIELMLYKNAPEPTALGVAHHICLVTANLDESVANLEKRPYRAQYKRPIEIRTGTNRKRQANLYDPDGTRTELMEPVTVDGTAPPSSTAPPPR